MLGEYRDREGGKNWTHIYNDVAVLESRHAFTKEQIDIAKGMLQIYFGEANLYLITHENCLWNQNRTAGILGNLDNYTKTKSKLTPQEQINLAINNWVINLAKVGFHLFSNESK
ncbi:hypothetical protein [Merismopedia glauca]|uniref:Uncharacterized protein n=1 Tax=Merismopedia glauca CCAP 1448/3 TaxID=1296344 RepID=A0A2T1C093_9CYAN|nr:hypothetical protein [Merismopedia glauca]PSB01662.1 hypothetical protein C7B64_17095 [Merismopedia glauca CCAP 1448/3]